MPIPPKQSPFRRHVAKWRDCTLCDLCRNRTMTVFARGVIPCDVLFIGEGPGPSEDVTGKPFIGPAGKLLDEMIFDAVGVFSYKQMKTKIAFSNLVLCLPNAKPDGKLGQPTEDEIKQCAPRLEEFLKICKPSIIILAGGLVKQWFPSSKFPKVLCFEIIHPSAILQMDISKQGLARRRTVEVINGAFNSLAPF